MMRHTPRLLLALLLLQLWGCSIDRGLRMKCKGDCELDVQKSGVFEPPTKERK